MQDTILHSGALTVQLDSKGTATSAIAGRLPTLDDIARNRARSRYLDDPTPAWRAEFGLTDAEQSYLDGQGEL
jgi:hypothetical protein